MPTDFSVSVVLTVHYPVPHPVLYPVSVQFSTKYIIYYPVLRPVLYWFAPSLTCEALPRVLYSMTHLLLSRTSFNS